MKKRLIVSTILACVVTSNLYATKANCEQVPEGMELAKALKSNMYDKAEMLMKTFKLEVKNYRNSCDNSQNMFEQTQVSILTYEDELSDLKEDLKMSESLQAINCTKVPSSKKLAHAVKTGKEEEIKESYELYKIDRESYLNHCTLHEAYKVIFEESASYDDYYDEWITRLNR